MCDFIPQELWLATSLPKQTPFIASALFRAFDFETQKQGREREKLWQCCKLRERTWKRRLSQNNTTSGGRRKKVFRRRTLLPDIKTCRMSVFPTSWLPVACLKSLAKCLRFCDITSSATGSSLKGCKQTAFCTDRLENWRIFTRTRMMKRTTVDKQTYAVWYVMITVDFHNMLYRETVGCRCVYNLICIHGSKGQNNRNLQHSFQQQKVQNKVHDIKITKVTLI